MKIILYYAPIACSFVPYVILSEIGADFEVRPINIRGQDQMSVDYLRLNPKHKVPLLVVDGQPLSENVAIQLWISRSFPQANLLPSDIWGEAQAVSLLAWFASGIHPNISRFNAPSKACDLPGAESNVREFAKQSIFDAFRIADDMLNGRDFFFDHLTTPDVYFSWCIRRTSLFGFDLSEFRNCLAHFDRISELPGVQNALEYEKAVMTNFKLN